MQETFPDPITESCFVDVIGVTLAIEDNKSKLVKEDAELVLIVVYLYMRTSPMRLFLSETGPIIVFSCQQLTDSLEQTCFNLMSRPC